MIHAKNDDGETEEEIVKSVLLLDMNSNMALTLLKEGRVKGGGGN